nr:hypothetical protein [Tanacetum cinerariifolium]
SKSVHDTYPIEQNEHNVIIDSLDMSYDKEQIDQNEDDDLANEHFDDCLELYKFFWEQFVDLEERLLCDVDWNCFWERKVSGGGGKWAGLGCMEKCLEAAKLYTICGGS